MIVRTSLFPFVCILFWSAICTADPSGGGALPIGPSGSLLSKPKRFESLTIPSDPRTSPSALSLAIQHFRALVPSGDESPDWGALKDGAEDLLTDLSAGEIENISRYVTETDYGRMAEDFDRWMTDLVDNGVAKASGFSMTDFNDLEQGLRALVLGRTLPRSDLKRMDLALERISGKLDNGDSRFSRAASRPQRRR